MATTPFLGCRTCGRPAQEHDTSVVHRFVRRRARTRPSAGPVAARRRGPLSAETGPGARLQHGVDLLPTLVPGCQHASLSTVDEGRLAVRLANDSTSRRADELQHELDEGPSLQAARTGHSVVAHDLGRESRWPGWCSAAAAELGVRSVLSVLLVADRSPVVTLNLYSDTVDGLSDVDLALLHTLAEPLADALLDERVLVGLLGPAAEAGRDSGWQLPDHPEVAGMAVAHGGLATS